MNKQSFITILLTVLMSMIGAKAFAYDLAVANSEGITIYYNWANSERTELAVTFCQYSYYSPQSFYSGNLVIPESVVYEGKTYYVTSIGDYAFNDCSSLSSVNIPSCVKAIGESAFSGCSALASISIPNSVTFIGPNAFVGTAWIKTQPDGLVYAGKFVYCYKGEMPANTHVTIKDGALGIAGFAFYNYTNLTSVTIPNSVKSINYYAFGYCSSLTSVTIPNSVTKIDNYAFSNCSSLTTITSEITTPYAIGDILSGNYSQTTLIVPKKRRRII